jgi:uridine phosphorylase
MIEFDPDKNALFDPSDLGFGGQPEKALMIFDDEIWEDYVINNKVLKTLPVKNNQGRIFNTSRLYRHDGEDIILMSPSTGGAASAAELELLIASGIKKVVAFGTGGAMLTNIAKNTIIVPTAAIRGEGVSYHYLPPSEEVAQNPKVVGTIKRLFSQKQVDFLSGKIWTTDAVYRETAGKTKQMVERGCLAVDMELASLFAVAEFRGISLAGFLIIDDNIAGHSKTERPREPKGLLQLAIDIVVSI